jgi:hypothetical protein
MYADASAAIIVSAQTGQVGRSVPRRSECVRAVDGISAIAGIVTSSLLLGALGLIQPALFILSLFDDVATQIRFFYDSNDPRTFLRVLELKHHQQIQVASGVI